MTTFTPGTYNLLNVKSGTAVELPGAPKSGVVGNVFHGGLTQQWEFIPSGQGYAIRNNAMPSQTLYATVEQLNGGAHIKASPYPATWVLQQFPEGLRISWPNSNMVWDLDDHGIGKPDTRVQVISYKPGNPCQHWRYTRCEPTRNPADDEIVKEAHSEVTDHDEDEEFFYTTRTTTVTTVAVSKVAKKKSPSSS